MVSYNTLGGFRVDEYVTLFGHIRRQFFADKENNMLERAIALRGMYDSLDLGTRIKFFDVECQHGRSASTSIK